MAWEEEEEVLDEWCERVAVVAPELDVIGRFGVGVECIIVVVCCATMVCLCERDGELPFVVGRCRRKVKP